jgi:hypothetical protein
MPTGTSVRETARSRNLLPNPFGVMPDTFSVERGSLTTGVWWVGMAVKLHRCRFERLKTGPCWRVEKALKEMGVDYELAPVTLGQASATR